MPAAAAAATASRRVEALDGIRGVAIALVVLSHTWTLLPFADLRRAAPLDGLFRSGNLAVSIFLVIGGFLVTRTLLRRSESVNGLRPIRYWLERVCRIGVQLYPLLVVILLVHLVDPSDPYSTATTEKSAATAATFTWNWYLQNNVLSSRSDLGHLWYLSVQEQFYLGLILVIALFAGHRRRLLAGTCVVLVLVTAWRVHSWDVEGFRATVRTTTRMDGLLWGTLAALVADRCARFGHLATRALLASSAVIAVLVLTAARFHDSQYYKGQGVLINLATAVFVLATCHLGTGPARFMRVLTWPPLVWLGGASLAIYVWHYPLFWFIARHTHGWAWFARTLLGAASLAALSYLTQRYLDGPSKRWLHRFSNTGRQQLSAAQPIDPVHDRARPLV